MTQITKTLEERIRFGNVELKGVSYSETGDQLIEFHESIPAGQSKNFTLAFTTAELKGMAVSCDTLAVTVITDAVDTLLSATQYTRLWASTSGEASPVAGAVASIDVDNTGGAAAAIFRGFFLIENA